MPTRPARLIAYYLPQFHPIPENDAWWGKGFTEWTNTAKAKSLFRGHYAPHIPADLGFYDLRVPETRQAQAEMAAQYGIEGFCYYHYWFAGRRILERPFQEVLQSKSPDFPFCLCWANESWTGIWHGAPNRTLIEQSYPGLDDHRRHFDFLTRAFMDRRYVCVDGKPLFLVYRPMQIPDVRRVTDLWREWANQSGFPGLYLVGVYARTGWVPAVNGFDAVSTPQLPPKRGWVSWRRPARKVREWYQERRGIPTVYSYERVLPELLAPAEEGVTSYPCVIPNWDNSPRSGSNGLVLHGSTPELFRRHLRNALQLVSGRPPDHRLVFVKSWNEWAEGNHLEPDLRFGRRYLEAIRDELGAMSDESRKVAR